MQPPSLHRTKRKLCDLGCVEWKGYQLHLPRVTNSKVTTLTLLPLNHFPLNQFPGEACHLTIGHCVGSSLLGLYHILQAWLVLFIGKEEGRPPASRVLSLETWVRWNYFC